jgi:hypothetical protein
MVRWDLTDVSDEHSASIFRVIEYARKETIINHIIISAAFGKKLVLLATWSILLFCLAYSSNLKMEQIYSSETSVDFQMIASSEDRDLLFCFTLKSAIFWDVTPCSLVGVDRQFGGNFILTAWFSSAYCSGLKMEVLRSSETSVSFYNTNRRHRPCHSSGG